MSAPQNPNVIPRILRGIALSLAGLLGLVVVI
jgi:hypothetical protein